MLVCCRDVPVGLSPGNVANYLTNKGRALPAFQLTVWNVPMKPLVTRCRDMSETAIEYVCMHIPTKKGDVMSIFTRKMIASHSGEPSSVAAL